MAVLIALGLTFGMARAAGVNPDQPIRLDGMELFFGIIPAESLRGHPVDHEEQRMHGGVPRGKGVHHLIISVFDAKTGARITDAAVTGSVTEIDMATRTHQLETMTFGAAVKAIRLSRATMTKIKQNLFWASIHNSIGVPVAVLLSASVMRLHRRI